MFCLLALILAGIGGKLFYITLKEPTEAAASQNRRAITVATTRGTIYDRQLRPLVNEEKAYYAALMPDEKLLAGISAKTEPADYETLLEQLSAGYPAAVRLNGPVDLTDGLRLFRVPQRYGTRLLAPHVIGYLESGGQHGATGIEAACDALLTQFNGQAVASFAVDGSGMCLSGVAPSVTDTTDRSAGGVVLTLDNDIQTIVEDLAPDYIDRGAVVVLEPKTGAILAMASFPSFQPATVFESMKEDNGALLNRALSLYDCGSVFKIITAAAALESGISPQQEYVCSGGMVIQNNTFHCHNRLGHQHLQMPAAFAQSCNLYFIQLAQQTGAATLSATANTFGFGRAITLADGISTQTPVFPSVIELEASPAALANLSFGQGKLMTTPLHVAQIIAAVANNGEMPSVHLIAGQMDENTHFSKASIEDSYTILSPSTAQKLQEMMAAVVTQGTGRQAAPTLCSAAGKTGTAETGQVRGEKAVVQSWFAGYFPAEEPQYAVAILGEDANNANAQTAKLFSVLADKLYETKKTDQ